VNASLDEHRVMQSDRQVAASIANLGRLVRSSGAQLGGWIDSPGERLRLVDGTGRIVDADQALLAFVWLIANTTAKPRVALPAATSRVAQEIVGEAAGELIWTRMSPSALMATAEEEEADFAGDQEGGYVFPAFLPAFDGFMGLLKLLELLARAETTLEAVIDDLPAAHVARADVPTPWEAKGTVMRRMLEHVEGSSDVITIDGIKAYRGADWVLVIPHPQEPLVRVWAEAGTSDGAQRLAAEFAALVEEMRG
jgi:mannose-1-phosphate guanylyltransferase/phosphomannomutase